MSAAIKHIVIIGNCLAAHAAALALSSRLPPEIKLTFVRPEAPSPLDIFYGGITSPSAYDFLLSLGVTEPELFLSTTTSVSLGTRFINWGNDKRAWTQSYHRPLPIHNGVKFHHYVNRLSAQDKDLTLDPYIMSAVAADRGVFAHPPEGRNIPLATVEYGYHFSPKEWIELLRIKIASTAVEIIEANVDTVLNPEERIKTIQLSGGHSLSGDFFIDCRDDAERMNWIGDRRISGVQSSEFSSEIKNVIRTISTTAYGIKTEIPLREQKTSLHISAANDREELSQLGSDQVDLTIGREQQAWSGNVMNFGLIAGAVDPLTSAPMMLLQADVERLLELIPLTQNMQVEAREYNRRFRRDYDNAAMFTRALFDENTSKGSNYYQKANAVKLSTELAAKITQFQNRGVCVTYDNELFSESDWVSLYIGTGRRPARYDPLADRMPESQTKAMLENMARANMQMGQKLPTIDIYMTKFLTFLKEKHG